MKILLILTAILIAILDYLLIVGADERRYTMPTDIYHSPYNITRKGTTDIHECTKDGTTYEREKTTTEITAKVDGKE